MIRLPVVACVFLFTLSCKAQDMVTAANTFIATLNAEAKAKALYPFDSEERYNFHFFPKSDRKGIAWKDLAPNQQDAAMGLLKSCMSETGVKKAVSLMQLKAILKTLEHRSAGDDY